LYQSQADLKDVKLMSEQGYSIRAIARTLKIARKTVRKILGRMGLRNYA